MLIAAGVLVAGTCATVLLGRGDTAPARVAAQTSIACDATRPASAPPAQATTETVAGVGAERWSVIWQPATVCTFAGGGPPGFRDGPGERALFHHPSGIAVDRAGNVYLADHYNDRIRMVAPDGMVSTVLDLSREPAARSGEATVRGVDALAADAAGAVYLSDCPGNRIWRVAAGGARQLVAGSADDLNEGGYVDGPAAEARFNCPRDLALDGAGNLYVFDQRNFRVRKLAPDGTVSTLAGSGETGEQDGRAAEARFGWSTGSLAATADGRLFIGDGDRVRAIAADGTVSRFSLPGPVSVRRDVSVGPGGIVVRARSRPLRIHALATGPDGTLYAVDGAVIRRFTAEGEATLLAGEDEREDVDGVGEAAGFDNLTGLAVAPDGTVTTLASLAQGYRDGPGETARFLSPVAIAVDRDGNVNVADSGNRRLRMIVVEQ
jgi:hypothetical protein